MPPTDTYRIVCREQHAACVDETLPERVRAAYQRARKLAADAVAEHARTAALGRKLLRALRTAAKSAAKAARKGRLDPACAAALGVL